MGKRYPGRLENALNDSFEYERKLKKENDELKAKVADLEAERDALVTELSITTEVTEFIAKEFSIRVLGDDSDEVIAEMIAAAREDVIADNEDAEQ